MLDYDTAAESGAAVDYSVPAGYRAAAESGAVLDRGAVLDSGAVLDRGAVEDDVAGGTAAPDEAAEVGLWLRGRPLWSEGPGWHPFGWHPFGWHPFGWHPFGWRPFRRPDRPRPAVSRQSALRARRRMLITLLALTAAALALTVRNIMPWWIVVAPSGTLGTFVLLLREAARADADAARRRAEAEAAHAARDARVAERQRARDALAARVPEPTAEIIDISARVGDQLYDQNADAAVRAVGD